MVKRVHKTTPLADLATEFGGSPSLTEDTDAPQRFAVWYEINGVHIGIIGTGSSPAAAIAEARAKLEEWAGP